MFPDFSAFANQPALTWFGCCVLALSAHVMVVIFGRIKAASMARRQETMGWLFGAAFALGTGVWASYVIAASAMQSAVDLQYHPAVMLSGWVVCVAVVAAGVGRVSLGTSNVSHTVEGAVYLGVGISAALALWTLGIGLHASVGSVLWPVSVAVPILMIGSLAALTLLGARFKTRRLARLCRPAAGTVMTAAIFVSQYAFLGGSGTAPVSAAQAMFTGVSSLANLTPLAAVGATSLLVLMLICSRLDARMRTSLRRARGGLPQQASTDALTDLPNRVERFEAHPMNDVRQQTELLRDLKVALTKGQLELYFQPKIHGPSGEITGAEALVRWNHPMRGQLDPGIFIPIAERFGLINALGQWVIEEACLQIRIWRDEGLRMRVAINLSAHQLRQPDLAARIAAALASNQVNPQLLTCEITESIAMEDAEGTVKVFEALKAIGVHISIDDFGTGYSSLSYLCKLPVDELKIDRSFVLDLETSSNARAVVDAVVKLGQSLRLKVVAEGVETDAQNQILRSLGCDELQGFFFAMPMPARKLALWAMKSEGPRALEFRASLFKDTMPAVVD